MNRSIGLSFAVCVALLGCNAPESSWEEGSDSAVTPATQVSALVQGEKANRDRLLDTLAQAHGRANRCAEWNAMGVNQKGVFLTLTDMMDGAYMYPPQVKRFLSGSSAVGHCSACAYNTVECRGGYECESNGKTCMVYAQPSPYSGLMCMGVSGTNADPYTYKVVQPRTGAYLEKMLDHVTRIYSMAAETTSCGGADNRMYFAADDALISALRIAGAGAGPVGWHPSEDLAGPHAPFTQSAETLAGQPRGQTHYFAQDAHVVPVLKSGMSTWVTDPHLIEMDIDYNLIHDSNPECYYSGTYGRTKYINYWRAQGYAGNLSYVPTCP